MGQAVINAYVMYKAVCAQEKEKPMSHLAFHVAVATAWCKTPKLVLEYDKPSPAEARAAATANRGQQGAQSKLKQQTQFVRNDDGRPNVSTPGAWN